MDGKDICGVYSLTHLNGKKAPASATLCLTMDAGSLSTYVMVANVIRGRSKFENDRLQGMLLSSMAAGDKNQMIVEDAITGGFGSGFDVRRDLNRLLLKNENNALIFVETLRIEDIVGNHTIATVDGDPPKKPFTMRFTMEGNECVVSGSFGVPIRGKCRIKDGVLQGGLEPTIPDADDYMTPSAKSIIAGFRVGFQTKKNDTGLQLKCSECTVQLRSIVGRNELKGEYIFQSMDGEQLSTAKQLLLTFESADDNLKAHASIANELNGSVSLEQNILRSDDFFASSRMMGTETEMKVEKALTLGLSEGMTLSLVGSQLRMKGASTFTLLKVAKVDATQKGPTFKGTHVVRCFKTEGNGLLFRLINEVDDRWAFYNDTTDYRMHVHATFGSRSSITALGRAKMTTDESQKFVVEVTIDPMATETFIAGKVNGFKVLYSAEPVDSW